MPNDLVTVEVEGQHLAWCNELNQYKEEITHYEQVLTKVKSPTNKKEVEHFQNQFIIQKNAIDKLKNAIKRHDLAILQEGSQSFDEVPREDLEYHHKVSQKIETEVNILNDLKKEFVAFIG